MVTDGRGKPHLQSRQTQRKLVRTIILDICVDQPIVMLRANLHVGQLVQAVPVWFSVKGEVFAETIGTVTHGVVPEAGLINAKPMYGGWVAFLYILIGISLSLCVKKASIIGE